MSHLFVDSSSRVHDGDGQPYPTKCFERTFASRPYDHILICGHHIQTSEKGPCGSNCAPSAIADRKVRESAFACPVPHCAQDRRRLTERNKVFLPKPGQTRTRFRTCKLSTDPTVEGKSNLGATSERKYRTRDESHESRKRSRSPLRTRQVQTAAQREHESMDPAEALNILVASDEAYKALMELSGPGVRPKKDGRFKTRKDLELEFKDRAVAQALGNLHVLDSTELHEQLKDARRRYLASNPDFGRADKEFGEEVGKTKLEDRIGAGIDTGLECSVCGDRAEDLAFKCVHCLEFIFCNTCMMRKRDRHPKDKYHRFEPVMPAAGWNSSVQAGSGEGLEDADGAIEVPQELESYCKCETTSTEYLISCDDCDTLFHPGCFGMGMFEDAAYEDERKDQYLRADFKAWKNKSSWRCKACKEEVDAEVDAEPKSTTARSIRAKARAARSEKKAAERQYMPHESAAKAKELKHAATHEEKSTIEAKWQEIVESRMKNETAEQSNVGQMLDLGALAFRLKPQ